MTAARPEHGVLFPIRRSSGPMSVRRDRLEVKESGQRFAFRRRRKLAIVHRPSPPSRSRLTAGAIRAKQEGDQGRFVSALDRALELLDLTLADPRWSGPRLRFEIARTREVVCDFLVGDNLYRSTPELLDAYFLAFAIAARRDR